MKILAKTESGYMNINKCKKIDCIFDRNGDLVIYEIGYFNKKLLTLKKGDYLEINNCACLKKSVMLIIINKIISSYKKENLPPHFFLNYLQKEICNGVKNERKVFSKRCRFFL